jgi:hypothetical protein
MGAMTLHQLMKRVGWFLIGIVVLLLDCCSDEPPRASEFVKFTIAGGEQVRFTKPNAIHERCESQLQESEMSAVYEGSDDSFSIRILKVEYGNPGFQCEIDLDHPEYYRLYYTVPFDDEYNIEYLFRQSFGELTTEVQTLDNGGHKLKISFEGEMVGYKRKKDGNLSQPEEQPTNTITVTEGSITVFL